jgi:CheY-like chemotaxis protein
MPQPEEPKMKILLVDEIEENLASLEALLSGQSREIFMARSGHEALGILLNQEPSLIILETQMQVMNGLETAELIRGNPRTRNIPILFLSSPGIAWRFRFQGHEFGPTDCLYKPVDPDILRSKAMFFEEWHRQKISDERTKSQLEHALAELAVSRTRLRQTEENLEHARNELEQYRRSGLLTTGNVLTGETDREPVPEADTIGDAGESKRPAPVSSGQLAHGIIPSAREPMVSEPADEVDGANPSLHILLAEDNQINTRLVVGLIRHKEWTVDCAVNGAEAVEMYREKSYNLVLMDIQMPEMDGMEATIKIRELEAAQSRNRVPVIALSAHALKTDIDKALECGMDDYLTKPFRPLDFYQLIQKLTLQPKESTTN